MYYSYFYLPCELMVTFCESGLIVSHLDQLRYFYKVKKKMKIVKEHPMKADFLCFLNLKESVLS